MLSYISCCLCCQTVNDEDICVTMLALSVTQYGLHKDDSVRSAVVFVLCIFNYLCMVRPLRPVGCWQGIPNSV